MILRYQELTGNTSEDINEKTGKPSKNWNKVMLPEIVTINNRLYEIVVVILHKSKARNQGHYMVYIHTKKIIIDDEKIYYDKLLKSDYSYFYTVFYI